MDKDDSEETPSQNWTHFGYVKVLADEKAGKVAQVFESVARRYDLMNDLMTWGLHRHWKRSAVKLSGVRSGDRVLDLAGGTGDLALRLARRVGAEGSVVLADINPWMLVEAERRLAGNDLATRITLTQADAEALPFDNDSFDVVTISFGLRNVTDQDKAIRDILRVLKPGGRLVVLEFSRPVAQSVRPLYHAYSFAVLPAMGKLCSNDAASYRYLAESIRMHPDRDTLRDMIVNAQFARCDYSTMLYGIVAAHVGVKA
ncbi:MAG TPA: bifunctional demethylmenaquinone methyltransferase/2-methoxy-6-polyprenyl-1,4-benzoquinol methylase UbiE [Demequina sp.]|nr:bifunctional demethylmenaquinone methyltransferase/2-methoxy-6-polyprenyl-1,4-benzoquinol methylase UbiE [Demequina sp.]